MKSRWKTGSLAFLAFAGAASAAVVSQDWTVSLDLGASLASGNTDSTYLSLGINGAREFDKNIQSFGVAYAFGEEDGLTTQDSLLADASWKRLLSERTYMGLRADVRHDDLADIDYRASLSGLIGTFLIKSDDTRLSIEAGPGFTYEKVAGVSDSYFSVYAGQQFEHQLNESTKIYQSLAFFAPGEDLNDFQIIAEAGIETALSEKLNLKVYVEDKYENEPAPGRKDNDIRCVTGISYKF